MLAESGGDPAVRGALRPLPHPPCGPRVLCWSQIAAQVAVTFAKVARQDFPREWPSLLSDLLGQLQVGGSPQASGQGAPAASASSGPSPTHPAPSRPV